MKIKPNLRNLILATFCASSISLHAATINLDLATNNAGVIELAAGDNTFSYTSFAVDYLIVGGGGGGGGGTNHGSNSGGGGGAGGLREGSTSIGGLQNIVVGGGGGGGNNARGTTGQNSTALGLTSLGGGGGGFYGGNGLDGGSGGGAGARGTFPDGTNVNGGLAVGGAGSLGHDGGSRLNTSNVASGGGGAGGAGANGGTGTGGAGVTRNITGADLLYARGGSGTSGIVGADNTGGGGGGATTGATTGALGGSGIVIVRYTGTEQLLAGGIVSTVGGNTVHQFTGTSTLDLHSATIAGDISGDGNLVWDKTGTLTLSGTNTYTGSTTVSSGSLIVTGSITSALTVGDNTTMGGGGTVGNISFAGGSLFDMFQAVANNDSLTASAISFAAEGFGIESLRYDGSAVNWASIASNTYTLITGTLDTTNLGNFEVGDAYIIGDGRHAYFKDGSLQLVVENIPEPTTALLGGLGMLLLLRRRR